MQKQYTINILISQLLSKDDEILRLRSRLENLQKAQQASNSQIMQKLDRTLAELSRTFEELKDMRRDNKNLSEQLSQALVDKSEAKKKSDLLSHALEELKNTRASELFELEKQKRQLYGLKSEKTSSLRKATDTDRKKGKDDFDRCDAPSDTSVEPSDPISSEMKEKSQSSETPRKACRSVCFFVAPTFSL